MMDWNSKMIKTLESQKTQLNCQDLASEQSISSAPLHHVGNYSEGEPPNVFSACLVAGHGSYRHFVAKGWEGEQWDHSHRVLFGYGAIHDAPHLAQYEVLMLEINTDLTDGYYEIDANGLVGFEYGLMYTLANYMMIFKAVAGRVTFKFDRVKDVVEATFRDVLIRIEPYGNPGQGPDETYDLVLSGELRVYRGFCGERPYPSGVYIAI